MPSRLLLCLINAVIFSWAIAIPASGGDWPFARRKAAPEQPNSMVQIARSLDAVEEKIRDDGIVVIKQPDVWGQARMTKYRVDFEKSIMENLKFEETLSAVISRADRAALESQTAFGVSLTPGAKAAGGVQVTNNSSDDTGKGQAALVTAAQDLINKAKDKDGLNEFEKTETFKLMKDASTLFKAKDSPVVGLEPTVLLEEKKTFYDRLNQYRRQNMGDDSGDSAGYNLYQFGMPVSIQPGDKTHRDHGAQLTISIHHEFGPDFLATTYRTLVINDLVDRLTPLVYETIRDKDFVKAYEEAYGKEGRLRRRKKREEVEEKIAGLNRSIAELDRQVSEATSKLRSLYAQVPKEVFRVPITKLESPEQTKLVEEFGTSEGKKTYYAAQTNMASEVTFEAPPAPPPQNDPASPEWVDYRKKLDRYADLNRYETRVPTTPPSPPESYLNRISQAYRQTRAIAP